MARNRVIYQSEALYVSKNVASFQSGEHRQLQRVQNANYNFSIDRQDVNQFGQLARIDALVIKSPTVALDFSYYPTNGFNERALGFYVQTGSIGEGNFSSGQMGSSSGQNYYIVTTSEGTDLNYEGGATALSGKSIIGIGNGFLTNYTLDASVGNLPTVKVTVEGLNMNSALYEYQATGLNLSGIGVKTPQIDPTAGTIVTGTHLSEKIIALPLPDPATGSTIINALRPGDLVLDFDTFGDVGASNATPMANLDGDSNALSSNAVHVQSASLALPLSRTPIERLGSRFAFARVVDFPIVATLNVSAIVNENQARNLARMLDDSSERDITLRIKSSKNTSEDALRYKFKGARLKSESYSSSIGANKTVDLVFETQIGGPNDTAHGIFVSGISSTDVGVANWGY